MCGFDPRVAATPRPAVPLVNPYVMERLMDPLRDPDIMARGERERIAAVDTDDEQDAKAMFREFVVPEVARWNGRSRRIAGDSLAYYLRRFRADYAGAGGEDVPCPRLRGLNPLEGLLFNVPVAFRHPGRPYHFFRWLAEVVAGAGEGKGAGASTANVVNVIENVIEVFDLEMGNEVFAPAKGAAKGTGR